MIEMFKFNFNQYLNVYKEIINLTEINKKIKLN